MLWQNVWCCISPCCYYGSSLGFLLVCEVVWYGFWKRVWLVCCVGGLCEMSGGFGESPCEGDLAMCGSMLDKRE